MHTELSSPSITFVNEGGSGGGGRRIVFGYKVIWKKVMNRRIFLVRMCKLLKVFFLKGRSHASVSQYIPLPFLSHHRPNYSFFSLYLLSYILNIAF